jgi:hypothetical protein
MKTAVIISGHMRTFDRCFATMKWHVFRHLPPTTRFFVSTVMDEDAGKVDLLTDAYGADRVSVDIVAQQPDCVAEMRASGVSLPAEWQKGRPYTHEPYAISVHPQAVLRQLWQLQRAWDLYRSEVAGCECVIRLRPDMWFHDFHMPRVLSKDALVPWWGRFGGVNDRVAVLGIEAAPAYFGTYQNIPKLTKAGCPIHPESLVAASLADGGAWTVPELRAEFSTLRPNGEMRAPEISASDIACAFR